MIESNENFMEQSFGYKPQFHTALTIIDSIDSIGRE